jgi:arylsulfatase A-like enzyme
VTAGVPEARARHPRSYPDLRTAVRADVGRAIRIATAACAAFAVEEYVTTLVSYAGSTPIDVKARLVPVALSLCAIVWLPLVLGLALVVVAPRVVRAMTGGDPLAGAGFLAFPPPVTGPRPGPARMWAAFAVGLVTAGVLQRWAYYCNDHYKEKQLVAALVAVVAVLAIPFALVAYRGAARLLGFLAEHLDPVLGPWSPLGRWRAAAVALAVLVGGGILAAWFAWPPGRSAWAAIPLDQFRGFPPWRTLLPLAAFVGGGIAGSWWASHPVAWAPTKRVALALAAGAAVLIPLSLFKLGADPETRGVLVSASPAFARTVDVIRWANDLDGDGFGSLMGENDCAPFDPKIHPGFVRDIPDNGVDENCDGRDLSLRDLARPPGDKLPVPPAFQKPWNVLLLTIDTVRYDHTSFGGYRDGPKKRDTTPRLAELVDRATSFTFASSNSAGTMSAIPAILTSRFFHSGIALDENVKKGKPPKLKPENLLLAEIMKKGGYATGTILSHEYFADWGMNQGMDSYDNDLGKDPDPFKITSSLITDRAIAWISRQQGKKWFLWAHYIDPHGRYVAHPDDVSYGTSEEDLYDGELHYTDRHVGRLLDELARLPGGANTIVVITSDHGDGFNEHGFINHGQALYRELLHVPLIFAVPDNLPRQIDGAVTNLDIVPTVAELCGIDVSGESFEGVSLVPQIFYGKEDLARVVFAETNFPTPLRAAISADQKLVYDLKSNLYQLYDLKKDPWEKTNLWAKDPDAGAKMKDELDRWLERVLYSRDPVFNQAAARMADMLVTEVPATIAQPTRLAFDDGRVEVLGVDFVDPAKPVKAGDTVNVHVYFRAAATPSREYKFQLVGAPTTRATFAPDAPFGGPAGAAVRSPTRATLDGLFGTDRWKPGEIVRDKFELKLPPAWTGDGLAIGLTVHKDKSKLTIDGPHPGEDQSVVTLGVLPITPGAASPPPTPPNPAPGLPGHPGSGAGIGSGTGSQRPAPP